MRCFLLGHILSIQNNKYPKQCEYLDTNDQLDHSNYLGIRST